ncbi:MAG: LysR family transcriptional regulator [Pseudomonadota bacterium]
MTGSLDRLTLLATFVRIAERGSISAAARDLGLSQPSASRQLADLENRLGAQLVRRTTHDLSLTPTGLGLLADARELLDGWQAIEDRHGGAAEPVRGQLKVVAPIALGQGHLVDVALQFRQCHPAVTLDWSLDDQPIRFAEIGCDCWIKIGPVPDETLIVRSLGRVERLVVGTPAVAAEFNGASGVGALDNLPCAALQPFEGGRIELKNRSGQAASLSPPVTFSTTSIAALHRAVLADAGFAVFPRWFVEADLASGRLVDLMPDWRAETLTINVAYAPSRFQPRRLTLFLDALGAGVPAIAGIDPV